MGRTLKIGITAGDTAGIGPEVAFKAVNSLSHSDIIPIIIGRVDALRPLHQELAAGYEIISSTQADLEPGKKYLYDIPLDFPLPEQGKGTLDTGLESLVYVNSAVELWKRSFIDAMVTGPVNKGLIEKSGTKFTGHTEHIAGLIGEGSPLMMMFSEKYRVLLASTHIPVADIPGAIDEKRLSNVISIGYRAIASIDRKKPLIAIAGLDPHCGDGGAIGSFDTSVTAKVVRRAREAGMAVEGPFSADTLFLPERWARYSLLIAHYHDQGLIPFKILAFEKGVNVTIGLPITRTSVDHGTAYDIAGKGIAKHESMLRAIELAYLLEINRDRKV